MPYELPDDPNLAALLPTPRPGQTQITRVRVRHEDNPMLWDNELRTWTPEGLEYMSTLHALTGHDKDRLLYHKWVSAEGLVYMEYDPETHVVDAECAWSAEASSWVIRGRVHPDGRLTMDREVKIHKFIVGGDRGWTHAGSLQLWAIDHDGRMWLVKQAHHTEKKQSWWSDLFYDWYQEYGIWRGWFDSSEPEWIEHFNDRIGCRNDRESPRVMHKANKAVMTGINEVKERLKVQPDGLPRQLILSDSLCHDPDPSLAKRHLPINLQEEREAYSWKKIPDGKEYGKDAPEKEGDDSEDACRYATMGMYRKSALILPAPKRIKSIYEEDIEATLGF